MLNTCAAVDDVLLQCRRAACAAQLCKQVVVAEELHFCSGSFVAAVPQPLLFLQQCPLLLPFSLAIYVHCVT